MSRAAIGAVDPALAFAAAKRPRMRAVLATGEASRRGLATRASASLGR